MRPISEKTSISIGLLISLLSAASFVVYVSAKADANSEAIKEIKNKQNAISEIQTDIAVIKEKLEQIKQALGSE